jgi:phosphoribosylformylglycinamidine cyclo-ligase
VKGVADGCKLAGCSLIGGEMAEMPGFYESGEYDLAGFAVGLADKAKMISGEEVAPGDAVIGLGSSGLHSNGYSLVRSVLRIHESSLSEQVQTLGRALGEELLEPTRIYAKSVLGLKEKVLVKACCNITGGGFYENMPRMLKQGIGLVIEKGRWEIPPVFELIRQAGEIGEDGMYGTFNMGIGMALIVSKEDAQRAVEELSALGEKAQVVGWAVDGQGVQLC